MAFFTILTSIGQAKIANAVALGQQIQVTEMALGDGNGNPTTPSQSQTGLVRQVYRAQLNQLSTDPANPNYVIAELVVPSDVGGWTVREVGLYDVDGQLLAVGNFPETYKPQLSEGATRDLVVRVIIEVSNASVVQLKIDPSIVLASRQWVVSQFLLRSKVAGGLAGQVLAKNSNTDEDFKWVNPNAAVDVIVDVKPERQTLASGQTVVNFATIQANGIAVYIEGVRLIETVDYNVTGAAQITLAESHPAGSIIHAYQNDALDGIAGASTTVRGLVELATLDELTAGTDTGRVPAVDVLAQYIKNIGAILTPAGAVQAFARSTPPLGWLRCNGAAVNRTTYNALFAAIGTTFGAGDGSTTFNLPDLRGEFIRGLDDGRGVDSGRLLGSNQGHALQQHNHYLPTSSAEAGNTWTIPDSAWQKGGANANPASGEIAVTFDNNGSIGTFATETRPRNVALLYCIKA
ncbi:tail fiber [Pseudomonas phage Persinger]|uniref:Tail fiber n=1 Tax=Pseudomonas phage Persinger TaxID=2749430 RepID=A0A7D7ENG5_9CAUD|nr:tail protein [Pseudomonas phage Persinger]QMP19179.1 tail fiber [Pseudomonas phage Persinger]